MLPLRRSVADLSLFCEKCLQPLRAEQALTKEQEAAVFSNWEVIRGVNQQLLDALSAPAPEVQVAAASCFMEMRICDILDEVRRQQVLRVPHLDPLGRRFFRWS